jgi:hypothetical protein
LVGGAVAAESAKTDQVPLVADLTDHVGCWDPIVGKLVDLRCAVVPSIDQIRYRHGRNRARPGDAITNDPDHSRSAAILLRCSL